ncbi:MAG: PspC domain-containing protein [Parabacteroides sp.]|nr:PspC domain-containing protein [Parabacteroides sp.]
MSDPKKLYRSNSKMIGGICAGIAEYLEVDPTIVRIVYAILTVFTLFSGIIIYIILWIIVPKQPEI